MYGTVLEREASKVVKERPCDGTVLERAARLMYRKRGCVRYSSRERSKVDVQKERSCTVQF